MGICFESKWTNMSYSVKRIIIGLSVKYIILLTVFEFTFSFCVKTQDQLKKYKSRDTKNKIYLLQPPCPDQRLCKIQVLNLHYDTQSSCDSSYIFIIWVYLWCPPCREVDCSGHSDDWLAVFLSVEILAAPSPLKPAVNALILHK